MCQEVPVARGNPSSPCAARAKMAGAEKGHTFLVGCNSLIARETWAPNDSISFVLEIAAVGTSRSCRWGVLATP
jgi:hypothetical protein